MGNRYKIYFVEEVNRKNTSKIIEELKKIFNKENPDIIHSHFDGYDVPMVKASSSNVIKICHRHNNFDISNLPIHKKLYAVYNVKKNMWYLKDKTLSIFTAEEIRSEFLNKKYIDKEKSVTIINGINTKRLDSQSPYINSYNKPIIFSFIGDWHRKGADILFSAIEKINADNLNVYLAIICKENYLIDKIGYIPEWVILLDTTDNMKEYYSMADLFISASRKETFSYALAEAIYCKIPCLSSDVEGVQWAKEIPSVDFFENENVSSLVRKIKVMLNCKPTEKVLIDPKNIIIQKYSETVWTNKIIDFYESCKKV
ncbi:glycosyltransferase family 4 protein [Turicibacter bilis]|uniref:Glycosyltransferase family 4 protein n=1 Tax=Turicibacter bilis TaxID=2735723 RepID=A0ABY5JNJ0_9FIRM|nr:glycosyltransferase family 4 protein [Turicibacter bilis]MBS3200925.1 glycosyltransferase family 4 protein [Turicibacter bilis]UUF07102.1 glycosyltransferase family 4 protein [Turicibacter bilis]